MLNGIKNFLEIVNENWTTILIVLGIIISIVQKTIKYFSKTKEERIEIAKKHIQETMLKMIGDAEEDYEEWNKAGQLKRAQVIKQIFDENPILSKVVNQNELIDWIDDAIDDALVTLRDIVEENKKQA